MKHLACLILVLCAALGFSWPQAPASASTAAEKPLLGLSEGRLAISGFWDLRGQIEPVAAYQFAGPTSANGALIAPQAWAFSRVDDLEIGFAIGASYRLAPQLHLTGGLGYRPEPSTLGLFVGLHLRI